MSRVSLRYVPNVDIELFFTLFAPKVTALFA